MSVLTRRGAWALGFTGCVLAIVLLLQRNGALIGGNGPQSKGQAVESDLSPFPPGEIVVPQGFVLVLTGLEVPSEHVRAEVHVNGQLLVARYCGRDALAHDATRSLPSGYQIQSGEQALLKAVFMYGDLAGQEAGVEGVRAWGYMVPAD